MNAFVWKCKLLYTTISSISMMTLYLEYTIRETVSIPGVCYFVALLRLACIFCKVFQIVKVSWQSHQVGTDTCTPDGRIKLTFLICLFHIYSLPKYNIKIVKSLFKSIGWRYGKKLQNLFIHQLTKYESPNKQLLIIGTIELFCKCCH